MEKAKLHGVEIDPLSGRIARQLYQKANIAVEGFEKTKLPDNHFDVVIGNVPFGEFKVDDSRYNAQKFLMIDASPVPFQPVDSLEVPAYYDSEQQAIFIRNQDRNADHRER